MRAFDAAFDAVVLGQVEHERRGTPRAQVSFSAHLRWQERETAATVESLGAEGLFVTTDEPPPVGAEVQIEWELPSDRAVASA